MSDWKNVQYKDGKFKTGEGGGGGGASNFADLDDVNFLNLQNGQVPKYNSTTQKWENADESGGGGTVTDVTVDGTSVVNQQGVAEITMPTPPTIPVTDVKVNGTSVVDGNNEAQIKSYKEVTQAEYNALPASKTSDDILYCIKDAGGADGFPPLIYSDEEREVGVWRDGKPLYQKYISFASVIITNPNTWYTLDDVSSLGIGGLVDALFISDTYSYTIRESVSRVSSGNLQVYSGNSGWACDGAILWYTKGADTAGSGTWTTQGGYAHHYNTTERIIGTWIDSKPLYEKTFELTTPNRSGATSIENITSLNVNQVILIEGFCLLTNDTFVPVNFYAGSSSFVDVYATKTSITCSCGSSYYSKPLKVIIRYTKTTD